MSCASMRPAALSIAQATESGTLYTPAEVAALATIAHAADIGVHMDGAPIEPDVDPPRPAHAYDALLVGETVPAFRVVRIAQIDDRREALTRR